MQYEECYKSQGFIPVTENERESFLTPVCADNHIGQLVQDAAVTFQWPTHVAWTAHAVKHTALTALKKGVQDAVVAFVSGVVASTFNGYTLSRN